MPTNAEAVKRAIASLFTNKPITPSQAMVADLDIASKPTEHELFEPSTPSVRLNFSASYDTTSLPRRSTRLSRVPAGEAPQTREELQFWKHPQGYFVTIPGTALKNKGCWTIGKSKPNILRRTPLVAPNMVAQEKVAAEQKVVPAQEVVTAVNVERDDVVWIEQVALPQEGVVEDMARPSSKVESDYDSEGTLGSEEEFSDEEAYSKYDVLRRHNDEDTLIGEGGDYSMCPDSSDED